MEHFCDKLGKSSRGTDPNFAVCNNLENTQAVVAQ